MTLISCFFIIFFIISCQSEKQSLDFENEPFIVSHQKPTKHDSLLNQISSQRDTNSHSQHDHRPHETRENIAKEMDEHNHNILTKNHKIIDKHAEKLGQHPHTTENYINYNANRDINSELNPLKGKESYTVQSHDIEAMEEQYEAKKHSEELFRTFDWKHPPDAKKQEEIRKYNKERDQTNRKSIVDALKKINWHMFLPKGSLMRRLIEKQYYTFNENGKLANAITGEEINDFSHNNVDKYKDLIREEKRKQYIEQEYLANGVKSIDDDEIEDIEYDKAMKNEEKNKKNKNNKFLNKINRLLAQNFKIKGIKVYYIFYSVLFVALLSVMWCIIIIWIIYRNKRQAIVKHKTYFGEIGVNNDSQYINQTTDDIHVTIHQERLNDTFYEETSPSRDVIV